MDSIKRKILLVPLAAVAGVILYQNPALLSRREPLQLVKQGSPALLTFSDASGAAGSSPADFRPHWRPENATLEGEHGGKQQWSFRPLLFHQRPTRPFKYFVSRQSLFFHLSSRRIYALNLVSGAPQWILELPDGVASLDFTEGNLVARTESGRVFQINADGVVR